jgi:molybdenum cofactor biosynthesis protein B
VSDTRTETDDTSGARLAELLQEAGFVVKRHPPIRDEVDIIADVVRSSASDGEIDVIILTGGTGIAPRDVTPEAIEAIFEKRLEGFGEEFRRRSWDLIGPRAMLSRATAGLVRGSLVFSLPGSEKAVELGVELLAPSLPHMVDLATGRATRHP